MLHGKGGKKDVKVIVWSGLLFFTIAILVPVFVGYLPMSDGEYAQKACAESPLLTLPLFCIADRARHFAFAVGVSGGRYRRSRKR